MHRVQHRFALIALVGFCAAPLACGPHLTEERRPETGATLEGNVTYGKEKIAVALIIAQGDSGSSQGFVDDSGHYKLTNVPVGEVHLAVNTDAGKGQMMSRVMAQSQGKAKALPKVVEVPAKYFDPIKSGIKTTVNKGENTFDIVISR